MPAECAICNQEIPQGVRAFGLVSGTMDGDGCLGEVEELAACSKACVRKALTWFEPIKAPRKERPVQTSPELTRALGFLLDQQPEPDPNADVPCNYCGELGDCGHY